MVQLSTFLSLHTCEFIFIALFYFLLLCLLSLANLSLLLQFFILFDSSVTYNTLQNRHFQSSASLRTSAFCCPSHLSVLLSTLPTWAELQAYIIDFKNRICNKAKSVYLSVVYINNGRSILFVNQNYWKISLNYCLLYSKSLPCCRFFFTKYPLISSLTSYFSSIFSAGSIFLSELISFLILALSFFML